MGASSIKKTPLIVIILLLLAVSGGVSCGKGGLGVDAGVNTAGLSASENTDGDAFETGTVSGALTDETAPVSIPVPIAKLENGVDATSVHFLSAGRSETVATESTDLRLKVTDTASLAPTEVSADDSVIVSVDDVEAQSIGTVSGILKQDAGLIGLIVDNEFVADVETKDGEFSFEYSAVWLDKPVAAVLFADGYSSANPGTVGYPVIFRATYDDLVGDYTLTVQLTNASPFAVAAGFEIYDGAVAVSDTGAVAFPVLNAENESFLARVHITGGDSSLVSEPLDGILKSLEYSPFTDTFFGVNKNNGQVIGVDPLGHDFTVGATYTPAYRQRLRMHPSGRYFVTTADTVLPGTDEKTVTPAIVNIDDFSTVVLPLPLIETQVVTNISYDWFDSASLIIMKKFKDGGYRTEIYRVAEIMDGVQSDLPQPLFAFDSPTYNFFPVADSGARGRFVYQCDNDGDGLNGLCGYEQANGDRSELVSGDFNVIASYFAPDGSLVAFEAGDVSGTGETEVGLYDFSDSSVRFVNRGRRARLLQEENYKLVYLTADNKGFLQVALMNLPDRIDVTPLASLDDELSVTVGKTAVIIGKGGQPPYRFDIIDGDGWVNTDTGLYFAPGANGKAIVRVTDVFGSLYDVSVLVNGALQVVVPLPIDTKLPSGGKVQLDVSDGFGSYKYDVIAGAGKIDSFTGEYTAPLIGGISTVLVTDEVGDEVFIDIMNDGAAVPKTAAILDAGTDIIAPDVVKIPGDMLSTDMKSVKNTATTTDITLTKSVNTVETTKTLTDLKIDSAFPTQL